MRKLTTLLLLSSLFVSSLAFAYAGLAGKYTGTWTGAQSSGAIKVALTQGEKGAWSADVSFTLGDQDVKCKVSALSVEGAKIHVVYTFDLLGQNLESTIDGERSGAKLSGQYRTRTVADSAPVDQGTWDASST